MTGDLPRPTESGWPPGPDRGRPFEFGGKLDKGKPKDDLPLKKDYGTGVCSTTLGAPCAQDAECCPVSGGPTKCLLLPTGVKICTLSCTTDDPATPLVSEDSCPDLAKHICARLGTSPASPAYCVRKCQPTKGANTCPVGLACNPKSPAVIGSVETAICIYPPCKSGLDCPVFLADTCGAGVGCKAGASCTAVEPGSSATRCATPGVCNAANGLCAPNGATGKGAPGAPCKSDGDCLPQARCDFERQSAAGIHARNGTCIIEGCTFAKTLTDRACPPGSTCNRLPAGGICHKSCSLQSATDCRGNSGDKHGDYECYAWNNLSSGVTMLADGPTCEPADVYPCSFFQGIGGLDCSALGILAGNATQMACRDRATGVQLPQPKSPSGFCLDTTASGPKY